MARFSTLILFLGLIQATAAQSSQEIWSKVKIKLSASLGMKELAGLGVETDHGKIKAGQWFISDFSSSELRKIRAAGFETDVILPDVQEDFRNRSQRRADKSIQTEYYDPACNGTGRYKIPSNWDYGSMGSHLTYREMLNHLDSMHKKYPQLITVRTPLDDTIRTHNDSLIWFVRLTDQPQLNEAGEPKALFTAIHHAREPVGMHQLIFFMWYLLENYSSNAEINQLINRSDLYFVPCLNPDGYRYNEEQFPDGGGMWRKNRRNNGDGSFGVDLNRNYGYQWGVDDFGSSPDSYSDIYRGTEPFSEPETKSIRNFCRKNNFRIALNYHTFGNLLLHPWGYDGTSECPDLPVFRSLVAELSKENDFRTGTGLETLNYNSNGSSDDYMYATEAQKGPILAMTPEVGNEFWPSPDEILPLCLKSLHQNLSVLRALHPMITFSDQTGAFLRPGFSGGSAGPRIAYRIQRTGSDANPNAVFNLELSPFGPGSEDLTSLSRSYSNLALGESRIDSILLPSELPAMQNPSILSWELKLSNGLFNRKDTLRYYSGFPVSETSLTENCDVPSRWIGSWVVSAGDPLEGTGSLKTAEGNYQPLERSYMRRIRSFDLRSPDVKAAEMSFFTRFSIEKNYDMAALQFSVDSGLNWIPVCTEFTKTSSPFANQAGTDDNGQDTIMPVWDGIQADWRKELIDLKDYLGNKLWMRFYFRSDDFVEDAGFAVDNIRIRLSRLGTVTNLENPSTNHPSFRISPNPSSDEAVFTWAAPDDNGRGCLLFLRDAAGRQVFQGRLFTGANSIRTGLKSGCYYAEVIGENGRIYRSRWMLN